jgi:membrane associated rhomboid family serine protease
MGALLVMFRRRGIDPWATTEGSAVGALVLLNLVLTFAVPSISVGGHVGGLLGGGAAAFLLSRPRPAGRAGPGRGRAMDTVRTVGFAVVLLLITVAVAGDLVRLLTS